MIKRRWEGSFRIQLLSNSVWIRTWRCYLKINVSLATLSSTSLSLLTIWFTGTILLYSWVDRQGRKTNTLGVARRSWLKITNLLKVQNELMVLEWSITLSNTIAIKMTELTKRTNTMNLVIPQILQSLKVIASCWPHSHHKVSSMCFPSSKRTTITSCLTLTKNWSSLATREDSLSSTTQVSS